MNDEVQDRVRLRAAVLGYQRELAALRAERDRYRGALEEIDDECEYAEMGGCGRPGRCNACIARAALSSAPAGPATAPRGTGAGACKHGIADGRCVDCRAAKLSDACAAAPSPETAPECEKDCGIAVDDLSPARCAERVWYGGYVQGSLRAFCARFCRDASKPCRPTPTPETKP